MEKKDVRISVITASFDSEATIEDTVRSVVSQSHPAYEYIVIDGGSGDATVEIVEGYRSRLEEKGTKLTVISESDNGMYDAMNKGIALATGDIIGIINSDDWYEKEALEIVSDAYEKEPFDLFYADLRMVFPDGRSFVKHSKKTKHYETSRYWNHPTTFITKETYERFMYRTDNIHDDYDLILRLKKAGVRTTVVNRVVADFRMSGVSHTRSLSGALSSIKLKYEIYRRNGYGWYYIIEPVMQELGKLIIG